MLFLSSRARGRQIDIWSASTAGEALEVVGSLYRRPTTAALSSRWDLLLRFGCRPAATEVRHDQRDDRDEVDLPEQRLGHRKRVAEVRASGEIAVAEGREVREAEVDTPRDGRR